MMPAILENQSAIEPARLKGVRFLHGCQREYWRCPPSASLCHGGFVQRGAIDAPLRR